MVEPKAKYIIEKENQLNKSLEKSAKLMKEIINWYDLSIYDFTKDDMKNLIEQIMLLNAMTRKQLFFFRNV